jgi:hypothetical protein
MLLSGGNNIAQARAAATETVNAYCARNQADLITIAQIIGFSLAALDTISLSMTEDLSPAMTLRLRGNASVLNRAAEQHRRIHQAGQRSAPAPRPQANPPLRQQPAKPAKPANQDTWAIAMASQANEITAGIANLPTTERNAAAMRAEALSSTANNLLNGSTPRPLRR